MASALAVCGTVVALLTASIGTAAPAAPPRIEGAAVVSPLRTAVRLDPPVVDPGIGRDQQRVLELVNLERTSRGLQPLTYDGRLAIAAQLHSEDQAQRSTMTHTGADGSNAGQRIARQGFAAWWWGENVAMGYSTPESVVSAWMASPGHRANILAARATHLGVGVAWSSSGYPYWTQVFAELRT